MDKITYTNNEDGTYTKTVIHTEIIDPKDKDTELASLEATLANYEIGRTTDAKMQQDIDSTIDDLKTNISVLSS